MKHAQVIASAETGIATVPPAEMGARERAFIVISFALAWMHSRAHRYASASGSRPQIVGHGSAPLLDSGAREGLAEMPRLTAPPLPKILQPKPKRPGQNGNGKETPVEAGISVVDWIDERTSLSGGIRWMLFRKVPKGINWAYTLGSATMFVFLAQAVTGVFLAMYYQPSTSGAYESILYITDQAFLGQLVRSMHFWGASVMVILIFAHMARVFFYGAYKYPRELNWIIGVVLLILTMAMAFSGYLLPFDQKAYWATIVGVNINGTGPFIGPYLSDFLRAGPEFGATTLARFYAIHMMLIPGLIAVLIGAHLYLVSKLGISAPPSLKAEPEHPEQAEV